MTQQLEIPKRSKVLEIGTGSGYQTAILSRLSSRVYSIERYKKLVDIANKAPRKPQYIKCDNSFEGWLFWLFTPSTFDRIIITAAVEEIPNLVVHQLKVGGIMIVPRWLIKPEKQSLLKVVKTEKGLDIKELMSVRFVQMKEGLVKI